MRAHQSPLRNSASVVWQSDFEQHDLNSDLGGLVVPQIAVPAVVPRVLPIMRQGRGHGQENGSQYAAHANTAFMTPTACSMRPVMSNGRCKEQATALDPLRLAAVSATPVACRSPLRVGAGLDRAYPNPTTRLTAPRPIVTPIFSDLLRALLVSLPSDASLRKHAQKLEQNCRGRHAGDGAGVERR